MQYFLVSLESVYVQWECNIVDKVSVVIPTYNRVDVICDAIDSVLGQTHNNIEIIVVDDGSTDNTLVVLEKYHDRIKVVSQGNQGCSAARNTGIRSCSGDYIAFLDSDDKWLPQKTEKQLAILNQVGPEVVCCWCNLWVEKNGAVLDRLSMDHLHPGHPLGIWLNPFQILATRFILFNQAVMVRREALEKVGYFDESLWVMEDYDFAVKLSLLGSFAYLEEPLVLCRELAHNRISEEAYSDSSKLIQTRIKIYDKYINDPSVCRDSSLRHMKINRHLCVLKEESNRLASSRNIDSIIFRTMIVSYLKIAKVVYRRFALLVKMKTKPLNFKRA